MTAAAFVAIVLTQSGDVNGAFWYSSGGASVPSDRRASRQAVRVALRAPEQGCLVQAEIRFGDSDSPTAIIQFRPAVDVTAAS